MYKKELQTEEWPLTKLGDRNRSRKECFPLKKWKFKEVVGTNKYLHRVGVLQKKSSFSRKKLHLSNPIRSAQQSKKIPNEECQAFLVVLAAVKQKCLDLPSIYNKIQVLGLKPGKTPVGLGLRCQALQLVRFQNYLKRNRDTNTRFFGVTTRFKEDKGKFSAQLFCCKTIRR